MVCILCVPGMIGRNRKVQDFGLYILRIPDMIGRNRQVQDYGLYTLCTLHDGEKSSGSELWSVYSVYLT